MTIFYTDSGSFNDVNIDGNIRVTGSLALSNGGLTGSLFGTSSWAKNLEVYDTLGVLVAIDGQEITPSSIITQTVSASTSVTTNQLYVSTNIDVSNGTIIAGLTTTPFPENSFVVVWDEGNGELYVTASGYGSGGGGSGKGFPFSGSAIITGSLLVSSSITNAVTVQGSVNDFFEIEVNNKNTGNVASSDIVATSDNGNDLGNYINMGINSTTYNSGLVGGPSDGYMYLTSSVGELHVGNASTGVNGNIRLFAGGPSSDSTTRVFISSSGNVGINTTTNLRNTLSINGSISASAGITGSFTGSFSGSLDRFNPATLRIAVGTTAPASPAVNDLWVDTN